MAPHPSFCRTGIHTWGADQVELAVKVEKQAQGGAGPGPRSHNSLKWNPSVLMPSLGHVWKASIQNTPRNGVLSFRLYPGRTLGLGGNRDYISG